ncbi:MAG: transcription-repair coupling factor [Gammaproteobacteria bacterium]|nr:transcription-repair coupling factor [Gammaproteobacteria bacterium]
MNHHLAEPSDNLPHLQLHQRTGEYRNWGALYGSSIGLVAAQAALSNQQFILLVTSDMQSANRLMDEIRFYLNGAPDSPPLLVFPDWEILPYDRFSPHQDIISERLRTLYQLPQLKRGILVVPVATLMQRLPPRHYVEAHTLLLSLGDHLPLEATRQKLEAYGYRCVQQVMDHGEFAIRGSLLDLYPSGSRHPFRLELFDDELETIRRFDVETQRSGEKIDRINLLPAREFPLDDDAIRNFRQRFRTTIAGDPQQNSLYREISKGIVPAGVDQYLPLFFDALETLFHYLPQACYLLTVEPLDAAIQSFRSEIKDRYELSRFNSERTPLPPAHLYLADDELYGAFKQLPRHRLMQFEIEKGGENLNTALPPALTLDSRQHPPSAALEAFYTKFTGRTLFVADSPGRREVLQQLLAGLGIRPQFSDSWQHFIHSDSRCAITIGQLEAGLYLPDSLVVISESQLFGNQVQQRRRRQRRQRDSDAMVRNLAELTIADAVVHEDHGVGRFLGLQRLNLGGYESEFLALEYAGGDKLYVPVTSLHLISRYTGIDPDKAPLHRLGSGQWEKAKRQAKEKIRDVAAELLAIYAEREARSGFSYTIDSNAYQQFSSAFPFEETPDQEDAIHAVVADMQSPRPMDRLICGDVGFGKTEVAMRAAFIAVMGGKQVAVLVPTTLLSEQHLNNFQDRFADWPVEIAALSRFRSAKEQKTVIEGLESGKIDIVIGTHKLIQDGIKYPRLGLVIIDEEHRFGVRQKDRFKALRAQVDILTLTATPIPRTLNMALGGMRELSIIASPPARRLAVKTFVHEWENGLIREASLREIKRGGQIYFLHNDVESIEKMARDLSALLPEASVAIAHGQMRERELEQVMRDFYHQRYNILVCTTIIETGIDIPSANTIIINRADRLGLAQLYQLRGRVGRSHHRAYAYLLVPSTKVMSSDARKRLEAIEAIETLGTGFTLATHDLEIRGAGELLGEDQSGQMQEIGFTLYAELLDRTVKALKEGRDLNLDITAATPGVEIEIGVAALIPDDYIVDIHTRLILYKRLSATCDLATIDDLQAEIVDRFGPLPEATQTLFSLSRLKQRLPPLGIEKVEVGPEFGRLSFIAKPPLEPMIVIRLIQSEPQRYQLDSQQRLKWLEKMASGRERLTAVTRLLDLLEGK